MMVEEYLRQAEKYILENNYEAAEREITRALDLDPDNAHAHAYLAAVQRFRAQHEKKEVPEKKENLGGKETAGIAALTILIVDDEPDILDVLRVVLSGAGYEVCSASSPEGAIQELKSFIPDLILCDIRFNNSDVDGFFLLRHVRNIPSLSSVPFIFITGFPEEEIRRSSREMGVDDFITKPFDSEMLLAVIEGKILRFKMLANKKSRPL